MVRGHIASSTRVLYMWHRIWYVPVPHFHSSISQLSTRSLKKEGRKTLTVSRTHTYKHTQTHIHTTHIQHTHTQKTNSNKTNIKINKTKHNKLKTLRKLTKPYLKNKPYPCRESSFTSSMKFRVHVLAVPCRWQTSEDPDFRVPSALGCCWFSFERFGFKFVSCRCLVAGRIRKIRVSRFQVRWATVGSASKDSGSRLCPVGALLEDLDFKVPFSFGCS